MKKQIYITALHLAHGGVEMAISLMSSAFVKKGYAVTILSLYELGVPAYKISPEVKIEYLTKVKPNREAFAAAVKSKNPFKILKEGLYAVRVLRLKKTALAKRIQKIKDGIIISTRNEHSVILSKYGNDSVLKIAQLHHDHLFEKHLLSDIKNRYQNIDYFTLLTDQLTEEIRELLKGKNQRTRCVTMENFLDTQPDFVDFERKEKKVLAVGRLHPVKGFDRLLNVWKDLSRLHPDWELVIVGNGDEEEKLKNISAKLEIEKSVTFTGALDHDKVLDLMQRSSIYAMTSLSEGFPFVLIEAMSCGLPAIAYDVRVGPRAIIENGKNGFLAEDGNKAAYQEAMNDLMENEEKRLLFSKNAFFHAKDFTEEKLLQKWLSLFESDI